MKNRLFKVMLATGAVAMICACGDDSGSGNDTPTTNSADSGLPAGLSNWRRVTTG